MLFGSLDQLASFEFQKGWIGQIGSHLTVKFIDDVDHSDFCEVRNCGSKVNDMVLQALKGEIRESDSEYLDWMQELQESQDDSDQE